MHECGLLLKYLIPSAWPIILVYHIDLDVISIPLGLFNVFTSTIHKGLSYMHVWESIYTYTWGPVTRPMKPMCRADLSEGNAEVWPASSKRYEFRSSTQAPRLELNLLRRFGYFLTRVDLRDKWVAPRAQYLELMSQHASSCASTWLSSTVTKHCRLRSPNTVEF